MFSLTYFFEIADEVEVLNVLSTFQCDKEVKGLLRFYSENGFSKLPNKRDEYVQFIRFF